MNPDRPLDFFENPPDDQNNIPPVSLEGNKNPETSPNIQTSSAYMSRAVVFSFIKTYGIIPLNMLMTILLSRTLDRDTWGIHIYSLILIGAASIVLIFIPPSIESVFAFKVPEMILNRQYGQVKGLLWFSFRVKILGGGIIIIGYLIAAWIVYIQNPSSLYPVLILIQCPIIILFELRTILSTLINSMKLFRIDALITLFDKITVVFGYLFIFLIKKDVISAVKLIAFLNTLIITIDVLLYSAIYLKQFRKYQTEQVKWEKIKTSLQFGTNYSISIAMGRIYGQIYSAALNIYGIPRYNTYDKICANLVLQSSGIFSFPIGTVLSDLEKSGQRDQMLRLFTKTLKLINILVCLVMGALYFFIDSYIIILYPPEYVEVIPVARSIIIVVFFDQIWINYRNVFSIIGEERRVMHLDIVMFILLSVLAFPMMYFLGFSGLIYSKVIGFGIGALIYYISGQFIVKNLKIPFRIIFQTILGLFACILLTNFVSNAIARFFITSSSNEFFVRVAKLILPDNWDINQQVFTVLNSTLRMVVFGLLFSLFIILFRVLTREDIVQLEKIPINVPFKKQVFTIMKKILRKK